jgi:hypothetical protein
MYAKILRVYGRIVTSLFGNVFEQSGVHIIFIIQLLILQSIKQVFTRSILVASGSQTFLRRCNMKLQISS